jgi:hypothetical protein
MGNTGIVKIVLLHEFFTHKEIFRKTSFLVKKNRKTFLFCLISQQILKRLAWCHAKEFIGSKKATSVNEIRDNETKQTKRNKKLANLPKNLVR